jgi:hypothetical protein
MWQHGQSRCFSREVKLAKPKKIPADRLLFATISVLRTLVLDLARRGVIDLEEFVTMVQQIAATHRETGDPNNLADAMHAISLHLQGSDVR